MRPRVGVSSPASRRSTVDLPQPDGPTSATSSPSASSSEKSESATTPPGKTFSTRAKTTLATRGQGTSRLSVEEVLAPEQRQRRGGDRVLGEAALDDAVGQMVREREEEHGLVERQVGG